MYCHSFGDNSFAFIVISVKPVFRQCGKLSVNYAQLLSPRLCARILFFLYCEALGNCIHLSNIIRNGVSIRSWPNAANAGMCGYAWTIWHCKEHFLERKCTNFSEEFTKSSKCKVLDLLNMKYSLITAIIDHADVFWWKVIRQNCNESAEYRYMHIRFNTIFIIFA